MLPVRLDPEQQPVAGPLVVPTKKERQGDVDVPRVEVLVLEAAQETASLELEQPQATRLHHKQQEPP